MTNKLPRNAYCVLLLCEYSVCLCVCVCASLCGIRRPRSIAALDYRRSHRGITTSCAQHALTPTQGLQGHGSEQSLWRSYCCQWAWHKGHTQPTGHALLGCTCHTQFASFQLKNIPLHIRPYLPIYPTHPFLLFWPFLSPF